MSFRQLPHAFAFTAASSLVLVASISDAHFSLEAPPAQTQQDSMGNPQKAPPCGDDGTATPSGVVTTYQVGQTVTVTIDETIFHPGHYRIALAVNDPSELPAEPPVTAGSTACGSTTIMDPPVFPVLADGVFLHDAPFSGPQTIQITLPDNVTCDHCTLQIIQFMSNHGLNNPGGCFYHHCAEIAIQTEPVMTTTATTTGAGTGGGSSSGDGGAAAVGSGGGGANGQGGNGSNLSSTSGCDCALAQSGDRDSAFGGFVASLGLGLLSFGRRRQARR